MNYLYVFVILTSVLSYLHGLSLVKPKEIPPLFEFDSLPYAHGSRRITCEDATEFTYTGSQDVYDSTYVTGTYYREDFEIPETIKFVSNRDNSYVIIYYVISIDSLIVLIKLYIYDGY